MVYLIAGESNYQIKNRVQEEIAKLGAINDFSFSSFDLYNQVIQDALDDVQTASLFSLKKAVVVYNCFFISSQDKPPQSQVAKNDFSALSKYLDLSDPDNCLFLTCVGKMNLTKGEINDKLKKKAIIIDLNSDNIQDRIQTCLAYAKRLNVIISKDAAIEVVNRSEDNVSMRLNMDKLACYTSRIVMEDVDLLVKPKLEDNVFSIVESLMRFALKDAYQSLEDLFKLGNNSVRLIAVFASQFEFLYQVAKLSEVGYSDNEIAKELNCKPGRLIYSHRSIANMPSSEILNVMSELQTIEDNIKFKLDDPQKSLELFVINFRKNHRIARK